MLDYPCILIQTRPVILSPWLANEARIAWLFASRVPVGAATMYTGGERVHGVYELEGWRLRRC